MRPCLLYRFSDDENSSWKTKGSGSVKLMRHRTFTPVSRPHLAFSQHLEATAVMLRAGSSGCTRILLREEKTGKLRLNHQVIPVLFLALSSYTPRTRRRYTPRLS